MSCSRDGVIVTPSAPGDPDSGMNGDQLLASMKKSPAMMTSSTMPTLITTITKLTPDETRMPTQMTAVRMSTMAAAIRLCPSPYNALGTVMSASFKTSTKYCDQPTDTVAAPR